MSLSARRAWIEILYGAISNVWDCVALRKESVDRNPLMCTIRQMPLTSLSARRAWIEIGASHNFCIFLSVALRKESVDRNNEIQISATITAGRSPQGERG